MKRFILAASLCLTFQAHAQVKGCPTAGCLCPPSDPHACGLHAHAGIIRFPELFL